MHGHEDDGVLLLIVLVDVCQKGNFLEEAGQVSPFGLLHITDDVVLEFFQVLSALFKPLAVRLEAFEVTGLVHQFIEERAHVSVLETVAEPVDHPGELLQLGRAPGELCVLVRVADYFIDAGAEARRDVRCRVDRRVADAPFGFIDDAAQLDVVRRVVDDGQVRDGVPDLLALVEPATADDLVRNARLDERAFHGARLRVGAVQDGVVGELPAVRDIGLDDVGDVLPLHHGVGCREQSDLLSVTRVGPQVLALALRVVGDDLVRRVQDVTGGTVVLFEADGLRVFIVALKVEDVLDGGAAEPVDGLVVIADDTDVHVLAGQEARQHILSRVGVLVLVDEDITELVLVMFPDLRFLLEEFDGIEDHVVEVHGVRLHQKFLVKGIALRVLGKADVPHRLLLVLRRRQQALLGVADRRQDLLVGHDLVVDVQEPLAFFHDPLRVIGIIDGEVVRITEPVPVAAQDAGADGMEGARPDVEGFIAQERAQTVFQLVRGLVGESDGKDLPGLCRVHGKQVLHVEGQFLDLAVEVVLHELHVRLRDLSAEVVRLVCLAVFDDVGDAVDEDRGLPRPGAGQDQQRAFGRRDRFQLHVVHPGEFLCDDLPPEF